MKDITSKIGVTHRSVMGAVAKWAVEQSPYHRPDNLEVVLDKLHEAVKDYFDEGEKYVLFFTSFQEAEQWLKEKLMPIPEFTKWNERKNGNQSPYGFTSRYDQPSPDDDFIDLDALIRNATRTAVSD